MKIEIPKHLLSKIGREVKMDVHYIDVKLKNQQVIKELVVRGGSYITGQAADPDGIGKLNFTSEDIEDIRPRSLFKRTFNIW